LTPPLSRVTRQLRRETLALYAKACHFAIPLEKQSSDATASTSPVDIWLDALTDVNIAKLQSLQLSMHWNITSPTRWQTHVGFYLRLERIATGAELPLGDTGWKCDVGTYPIANDHRGFRVESIRSLRGHVQGYLQHMCKERQSDLLGNRETASGSLSLARNDMDFLMNAIRTVARNPISTHNLDQDEHGQQSRRFAFLKMESELNDLAGARGVPPRQDESFYTPY